MNNLKKISRGFFAISAVLILSAAISISGIFTEKSSALDSGVSLTISPVLSRINVSPGTPQSGTFSVINNGSVDYEVNIYANPYTVADNTYGQNFSDTNNKFSQIYRWIEFDETNFELKSGESRTLTYHVNPPESIPAGSQYGVIFAQTKQKNDLQSSGVLAEQRVGMLVFARSTNGETINSGKIISNKLGKMDNTESTIKFVEQKNLFYNSAPVASITQVKNEGNTDFQVTTQSEIKGILWGGTVKSIKTSRSVLPETTYQSTDILCNNESNETGVVVGDKNSSAKCELPIFGLFNMTTTVNMLGKDHTYTNFIVILPIWLLILIAVFIALVVFMIFRKIKKNSRKSKKVKSATGMRLKR